jgi:chromate transporter
MASFSNADGSSDADGSDADGSDADGRAVPLTVVAREWSRIGSTGFGGPPTHIRMLRDLCVQGRGWISDEEFEHAIATCDLLPGPASTQLAIFCAWRVAGAAGALLGGLCFIVPGLLVILVLAALFLANDPPARLSWRSSPWGRPCRSVCRWACRWASWPR